ncbi:MAG: universal stress protein [Vicinamibacterales bacterium]
MTTPFRVLVATDGSAAARAAVTTALRFPWPEGTLADGVVANQLRAETPAPLLSSELDKVAEVLAAATTRDLTRRWTDGRTAIVAGSPADVILMEARRLGADVIVVGWRGHGIVRRYLMGSVSRRVVRHATTNVLVVRRARTEIRRIVIAFDGSSQSKRAVDLVARFSVPPKGRITLVTSVDPMFVSLALVPESNRANIEREVSRVNRERVAQARQALEEPAGALTAAGWSVKRLVTQGEALTEVLSAVRKSDADLLVVGVAGQAGDSSPFVGGVADGALNLSTVPVLVVR